MDSHGLLYNWRGPYVTFAYLNHRKNAIYGTSQKNNAANNNQNDGPTRKRLKFEANFDLCLILIGSKGDCDIFLFLAVNWKRIVRIFSIKNIEIFFTFIRIHIQIRRHSFLFIIYQIVHLAVPRFEVDYHPNKLHTLKDNVFLLIFF